MRRAVPLGLKYFVGSGSSFNIGFNGDRVAATAVIRMRQRRCVAATCYQCGQVVKDGPTDG